MVNAWSSGTGMAGVLGSVTYIIFGFVVRAGGDNQVHLRHLTKEVDFYSRWLMPGLVVQAWSVTNIKMSNLPKTDGNKNV